MLARAAKLRAIDGVDNLLKGGQYAPAFGRP